MTKIYIQYSEFRAHSVFQDKCKLLKIPACNSILNTLSSLLNDCTWFLYSNSNNLTTEHRTILYMVQSRHTKTINTYRHTGTCFLRACFISRVVTFSRSGPHERADCVAPLSARLYVPCSRAQQR